MVSYVFFRITVYIFVYKPTRPSLVVVKAMTYKERVGSSRGSMDKSLDFHPANLGVPFRVR